MKNNKIPHGGSMLELEEGTGTEAMDAELLAKDRIARSEAKEQSHSNRYAVHIRHHMDLPYIAKGLA